MNLDDFKVGLQRHRSDWHLVDFKAIVILDWWAEQDERSKVTLDD